jgi:uncharacterized membrane protein
MNWFFRASLEVLPEIRGSGVYLWIFCGAAKLWIYVGVEVFGLKKWDLEMFFMNLELLELEPFDQPKPNKLKSFFPEIVTPAAC